EAYTMVHGFFLDMKSGKRGKQCRMDVHDAVGIGADEYRGEEPHETGKHNQFDVTGPQSIDYGLVKGLSAGKSLMLQSLHRNPVLFGAHEAVGISAIAEHDLDSRIEFLRLDGIDNGLKVGAAAGNQYADRNLSSHGLSLGDESNLSPAFFDLPNYKVTL